VKKGIQKPGELAMSREKTGHKDPFSELEGKRDGPYLGQSGICGVLAIWFWEENRRGRGVALPSRKPLTFQKR